MPKFRAYGVLVAQHDVTITVEADDADDARSKLEELSFSGLDMLADSGNELDGISVTKGDWNHDEAGDGWVILDDDETDDPDEPAIQEVTE